LTTLAATIGRLTAQDLGLEVDPYDMRAYYNAVRNRWTGLGDYADVAEPRNPSGSPIAAPGDGGSAPPLDRR
jgi:hypothetical protein